MLAAIVVINATGAIMIMAAAATAITIVGVGGVVGVVVRVVLKRSVLAALLEQPLLDRRVPIDLHTEAHGERHRRLGYDEAVSVARELHATSARGELDATRLGVDERVGDQEQLVERVERVDGAHVTVVQRHIDEEHADPLVARRVGALGHGLHQWGTSAQQARDLGQQVGHHLHDQLALVDCTRTNDDAQRGDDESRDGVGIDSCVVGIVS